MQSICLLVHQMGELSGWTQWLENQVLWLPSVKDVSILNRVLFSGQEEAMQLTC